MKFKKKIKCDKCGSMQKNLYGEKINLCRKCFNKSGAVHIISGPVIFDEYLDVFINIRQINLTRSQSDKLIARLDSLFPCRNKKQKFSQVSKYIRILILNDIESKLN